MSSMYFRLKNTIFMSQKQKIGLQKGKSKPEFLFSQKSLHESQLKKNRMTLSDDESMVSDCINNFWNRHDTTNFPIEEHQSESASMYESTQHGYESKKDLGK